MKIYNIQPTNTNNYYTKTQSYTSFKAIPQNLITDTFEKITNPKNKAVYEKLAETFKEHEPKLRYSSFYGARDAKEGIEKVYKALLDASGEVNDYALSTLLKLCYLQPDFSNPFTPFVNLIHKAVRAKSHSNPSATNWEEKVLDKTERCNTFKERGVGEVAKILEICKDKNGNHNQINLDFANWIEKNCTIIQSDFLKFINACKDPETGICREENIQIFKDLYKRERHYWFMDLPNEKGVVTETALKFLNDNIKIIKSKNEENSREDYIYCNELKGIINDALRHAKGEDRDEILKLINDNRDLLIENSDRSDLHSILFQTADKITKERGEGWYPTIKDYNINLTNLKFLINTLNESSSQSTARNFLLIKDKNGIVNEQNKECIKILTDGISWWQDECDKIINFKEARNEDGIMNIDFCKKFAETIKKYPKFAHAYESNALLFCLEYMKNKDDTVNWEAVETAYYLATKSYDADFESLYTKLTMLMRDENGDFCETGINKVKKIAEKYKDAQSFRVNKLYAEIEMYDAFEKAKDKNLFKADEMYSFLKQLQSKGKLTAEHFSTPFDEDGNTLLMYIADIPLDAENEYEYEKIVKMLMSTPDVDYAQQDKFGITFLEKVINSENLELLNLLKKKQILKYNPMLDYAYEGVQSQEFKKELGYLTLRFPELEDAVELGSTAAFEKVKSQLDSPFCDEKIKRALYNTALKNKNFTILACLKKYVDA